MQENENDTDIFYIVFESELFRVSVSSSDIQYNIVSIFRYSNHIIMSISNSILFGMVETIRIKSEFR